MKILLDESLPKPLMRDFVDCQVTTVVLKGWSGKKNGELLKLAQKEFDVFVTADQNLQYQQNIHGYDILVVVLIAKANRLSYLKPLVPKVLKLLNKFDKGHLIKIS